MYDVTTQSACLSTISIAKACAKQRCGRAGRVRNGYCYRLYSFADFEEMDEYATPEICRVSLAEVPTSKAYIALFVCLTTKAIHLEIAVGMSTAEFIMDFENLIVFR